MDGMEVVVRLAGLVDGPVLERESTDRRTDWSTPTTHTYTPTHVRIRTPSVVTIKAVAAWRPWMWGARAGMGPRANIPVVFVVELRCKACVCKCHDPTLPNNTPNKKT